MSKILAGLGGNAGLVAAGGVLVLAVGVGAYLSFGGQPQPGAGTATPATATAPQVAAAPAVSIAPPAQSEAATPVPVAEPTAPTFDELRRETDGSTVIAGRAAPLSEVKILVDGVEVAKTTADSGGGFAAFAALPAADAPQVVTLSAREGETDVRSDDQIILAPVAPRDPVALSETAPEAPAPAPTTAQPEAVAEVEPTGDTPPQDVRAEPDTPKAAAPDDSSAEPAPTVTAAVDDAQAPQTSAPVAVLKSDADGVRLLQAARPEAMTSVALDTIGYSAVGDVQLAGRAQDSAAEVRIYLDNRAVVSLPVDTQGRWQGDLPNVDEGVYTLRVDEVSAGGDVSSRVETPFKREAADVLAEAAAQSDRPIAEITVQQGATLWAIARDRYGDGTLYVRVFEANAKSIRDPDLIYPGQVFDLPED
ncbi:LysM peptidoglycan-binding domain-containing protein [Sulfitobacter albidus]|uniref:LysM peptidoglycan-binding domain-containing protein n=1 Tax=Sulfitobacter albidus TaxID=2829501 RepID=A0A975JFZ3_9RHOB|nr:LysM peptidoglycan-binding domain-containing protein [Sulfitobacter albidus]QUJ77280.1 LysM peptidoglycan-binding domain-containing protein [Sulfitobacter albidus]